MKNTRWLLPAAAAVSALATAVMIVLLISLGIAEASGVEAKNSLVEALKPLDVNLQASGGGTSDGSGSFLLNLGRPEGGGPVGVGISADGNGSSEGGGRFVLGLESHDKDNPFGINISASGSGESDGGGRFSLALVPNRDTGTLGLNIDASGSGFSQGGGSFSLGIDSLGAAAAYLNEITEGLIGGAPSSVKYDDASKGSVTLNRQKDGTAGDPVKLTNVAGGQVAQGSSDAVTGGQLWSLADSAAHALGGGFSYTEDKGISGSFVVNGRKFGTVQEALDGVTHAAARKYRWTFSVNGQDTAVGYKGRVSIAEGENMKITQDPKGTYVFSVSDTPEFKSVRVGGVGIGQGGINMGGGVITGLGRGGVYQGSRDAVTGGQLWEAYRRMDKIDERTRAVGAHAAALSALHPVPYNPYKPTTLSAGLGAYRGEQSVAVGLFHYVRDDVLVNAGVALNTDGDAMGRAGISLALGRGGKKQLPPSGDMHYMQQQMEIMRKTIETLKKENKEIMNRLQKTDRI